MSVSFTGEQWRLGAPSRLDRLDFQYSLDATSLTTGTWTDFNSLDFSTPNTLGSAGGRDGNVAGNRTGLSDVIDGLSIGAGSTFWFRWVDVDATSSDDGLAIDDFSVTGRAAPSTAVPDGGATLGLLSLGFFGLSSLRRRLQS